MRGGLVHLLPPILLLQLACPQRDAAAKRDANAPDDRIAARQAMVRQQITARGVRDKRVLAAMRKVKRHLFVPPRYRDEAYDDHPLPIGEDQTISQPYIVAFMTEALKLKPGARVLEIGTGSGYQAAVLGEVAGQVFTIEIVEKLGKQAKGLLRKLGYKNVHVRIGDGYAGWPDKAPFDAVMLTAAPVSVPPPLVEQLRNGGRLVAPVGPSGNQRLIRITKGQDGKPRQETLLDVRFVPMTGKSRGH